MDQQVIILSFLLFFISTSTSYNILDEMVTNISKDFTKAWVTNYSVHRPLTSYDYIIIGAGPAGCVIANRLTENPNVTVLLLESGKPEIPLLTDIPMSVPNLQATSFNFNYTPPAKQTKGCLAMNDQQCIWPHGKGLGGSTLINYMIYTRGNRRDYDSLSKMGNKGWSYDEIRPLFEKIEETNVKGVQNKSDGSVSVEDVPFRTNISKAFIQGAKEIGYNYVNYNGNEQLGVSYLQQTTKNGWRITSTKAYLDKIRNRPNLHILTEAWATKIIIDEKEMRATGVHYTRNGQLHKVKATREIILSAGAFESPKLLMLSGIGPIEELEKLKIHPVKDLPVGKTLYEHVGVLGPIYIIENSTDELTNIDSVANIPSIIQWMLGHGPLTSNGIESLLYMKTKYSTENDPMYPDMEIMQSLTSLAFDKGPGTRRGLNLRDDFYKEIFEPIEDLRTFQYVPLLLQPKTKGSLTLKSTNPFHRPIFNYTFFAEDDDVKALVEGMKEAMKITNSKAFDSLKPQIYAPKLPFCPDIEPKSDQYWKCYVRHFTATLHHQVGTTRMGPLGDKEAVVDERLRVHGFGNLRVADIGIIPKPPTGHTTSYSYVIGEKASQMLIEDAKTEENLVRQRRDLTTKKYFDWQKNPDLSSEESSETNSDETEGKPNLTLMDIILATTSPKTTTTVRSKNEISTILRPLHDHRVQRLEKKDGHHHRHHKHHRVKSNNVMTFADAVPNDDGHLNVSHTAAIVEQFPTAEEDHIKIIKSDNLTEYGKGQNKPKIITEKLQEVNITEFDDHTTTTTEKTEEFVVLSVGKEEKENMTKIHTKIEEKISRKKRQTIDLETIQNLEQALGYARVAMEKWQRVTDKVRQTRIYFRDLFGLPDLDSITVPPTTQRKRRETVKKSHEEEEMEKLKKQTMEFIDKERHENDKEKEIIFKKVKKQ